MAGLNMMQKIKFTPLVIDTPQFGAMWGQLQTEKKLNLVS
jgi:hypothetical protein